MRVIEIIVGEVTEKIPEDKLTIERILRSQLGLSQKEIRRAKFRENGICKNGNKCRVTQKVVPGDRIQVSLEDESGLSQHLLEMDVPLDILYEDQDLLVVNKPAGLVTHPKGGHFQDTLANQVAAYQRKKGEAYGIRPVGRLDKETSGIVVFAKNQAAAARLQAQRHEKKFQKTYLALVEGHLVQDRQIHEIDSPIGPDPNHPLKMCVDEQGKQARTYYQVEQEGAECSLIKVWIHTGRTHQIRVHMTSIGHPLIGDQLYGTGKGDFDRAALHAWQLEL